MAVYTDIGDSELEAFLARFDLGAPRAFKGIAEGVENSNFLLDTEGGRFILTLYERRVRPQDLPFFLGVMSHLAAGGFPAPTPIADRHGQVLQTLAGKPAALIAFLPGVSVKRPKPHHCREAGKGLAALHAAARGFRGRRENDLGQAAWRPLFAPLEAAAEGLEAGLAGAIARDLEVLDQAWPRQAPKGIIHADLFPDNVFFIDGRFAAAIDFYFACEDALAYDLGICLNAWCFEGGRFRADCAQALLAGYESLRPLLTAERDAVGLFAYGAAMRFFLTRLADWGRSDPGALVRPKDPLEYARILDFHRGAAGALDAYGLDRPGALR